VHAPVQVLPRGARGRGTVAAVRWFVVSGLVAALGVGAAGCGSADGSFANEPRPPSPITVTAAISGDRVRVSPTSFGAGPITVIVSNQSGAEQTVTFETDEIGGTEGGIRRSAGPVADQDTASFNADPREGTYRLAVGDKEIRPAAIEVGKRRASGRDQLLQP
jgi:hypothetical protein